MDADPSARLDPKGEYPAEGLCRAERTACEVIVLMPEAVIERTRDFIVLTQPGERGIIVLVTPEAVELRLPTIEWTKGSHGPASSSRLWKRVETREFRTDALKALIEAAKRARNAEFVGCSCCNEETPPEHRTTVDERVVCHECASRHFHVVF